MVRLVCLFVLTIFVSGENVVDPLHSKSWPATVFISAQKVIFKL